MFYYRIKYKKSKFFIFYYCIQYMGNTQCFMLSNEEGKHIIDAIDEIKNIGKKISNKEDSQKIQESTDKIIDNLFSDSSDYKQKRKKDKKRKELIEEIMTSINGKI